MPAIIPNLKTVKSFRNAKELEEWLATHPDRADELWLKIQDPAPGSDARQRQAHRPQMSFRS